MDDERSKEEETGCCAWGMGACDSCCLAPVGLDEKAATRQCLVGFQQRGGPTALTPYQLLTPYQKSLPLFKAMPCVSTVPDIQKQCLNIQNGGFDYYNCLSAGGAVPWC